MTQPDPFLTVAQAAQRLAELGIDVTTETIRAWARANRLRHVRLPSGRILFRPADVDAIAEPAAAAPGGAA